MLKLAQEQGLVEEAQSNILDRLVPKALDAVEKALEDGDAKVALAVLYGTGVLRKNPPAEGDPDDSPGGQCQEESFAVWRRRTLALGEAATA